MDRIVHRHIYSFEAYFINCIRLYKSWTLLEIKLEIKKMCFNAGKNVVLCLCSRKTDFFIF